MQYSSVKTNQWFFWTAECVKSLPGNAQLSVCVCVCVCVCVHAQSLQLCLTLCDPLDCNCQAPLFMEFSRQEYWSGLPCSPPGDLPNQGIKPPSVTYPALETSSLTPAPPGKPQASLAAAAAATSLQSCPTLCDPIDGSPPGSPIPGILQARTLDWVAISFSNAWKWSHSVVS